MAAAFGLPLEEPCGWVLASLPGDRQAALVGVRAEAPGARTTSARSSERKAPQTRREARRLAVPPRTPFTYPRRITGHLNCAGCGAPGVAWRLGAFQLTYSAACHTFMACPFLVTGVRKRPGRACQSARSGPGPPTRETSVKLDDAPLRGPLLRRLPRLLAGPVLSAGQSPLPAV